MENPINGLELQSRYAPPRVVLCGWLVLQKNYIRNQKRTSEARETGGFITPSVPFA